MPLGSERSSGSAVRLPVITTRLMLVAATALFLSLCLCSCLSGLSVYAPEAAPESRPACGRLCGGQCGLCGFIRSPPGLAPDLPRPRGGPEHLVPVRRADPEP